MKKIKTFEMWTTDQSGDFDVNYGDEKPQLSDTVTNTIDFIEENFEHINRLDSNGYVIEFKKGSCDLVNIFLYGRTELGIQQIKYKGPENSWEKPIEISITDFEYMKEYFKNAAKRFRKSLQVRGKGIIDEIIDPVKRNVKKFKI